MIVDVQCGECGGRRYSGTPGWSLLSSSRAPERPLRAVLLARRKLRILPSYHDSRIEFVNMSCQTVVNTKRHVVAGKNMVQVDPEVVPSRFR